jgi:integrase
MAKVPAVTNDELKAILSEKIPNKNTNYQYRRRLIILLNLLNAWQERSDPSDRKDESTLVLWCMLHPRKCYPILSQSYDSVQTTANMITFVLSLFKYSDMKCKYESPYKKWLEYHGEISDKIEKQYKSNEPTETQKNKYLTFDEMHTVLKRMSEKDPHRTRDESVDYCLIAMYSEIAPLRSDFGKIRVYTRERDITDRNYVVLGDEAEESYFVSNHYTKTQTAKDGTMKPSKRIAISTSLRKIFVDSCTRWPRKYLFVSRRGQEFETSAAYSKFVITVYKKHFGKPVGTSMLRHIYVTEKINSNEMSVADRESVADAMGHSRNMQDLYKLFVK